MASVQSVSLSILSCIYNTFMCSTMSYMRLTKLECLIISLCFSLFCSFSSRDKLDLRMCILVTMLNYFKFYLAARGRKKLCDTRMFSDIILEVLFLTKSVLWETFYPKLVSLLTFLFTAFTSLNICKDLLRGKTSRFKDALLSDRFLVFDIKF